MRLTLSFAWAAAVLGALALGLSPAGAAESAAQNRRPVAAQAKPVAARPAAQAARPAAAPRPGTTHATAARPPARQAGVMAGLPRMMGSARADIPPVRGRLAVSNDRQAAVSNRQCRGQGRARQCGPAMSWTRGLDPAAGVQASECPDGTMATPARGHENIIRCMPI